MPAETAGSALSRAAAADATFAMVLGGPIEINRAWLARNAGQALVTSGDLADFFMAEEALDPAAAREIAALTTGRAQREGLEASAITPAMIDAAALLVIGRELGIEIERLGAYLAPRRFIEKRTVLGGPAAPAVREYLSSGAEPPRGRPALAGGETTPHRSGRGEPGDPHPRDPRRGLRVKAVAGSRPPKNRHHCAAPRYNRESIRCQETMIAEEVPIPRSPHSTNSPTEQALLIAVERQNQPWAATDSLEELARLAETVDVEVVGSVTQKLAHPLAGTYVGKGKLEEIKARRDDVGYDVVMVDDDLTPAQQRNLERALDVKVIDRTALDPRRLRPPRGDARGAPPGRAGPARIPAAASDRSLDPPLTAGCRRRRSARPR